MNIAKEEILRFVGEEISDDQMSVMLNPYRLSDLVSRPCLSTSKSLFIQDIKDRLANRGMNIFFSVHNRDDASTVLKYIYLFERLGHKVSVLVGSVEDTVSKDNLLNIDAVVTPGNSYGHMTGGFDLGVVKLMGVEFQRELLKKIALEHLGELLVGEATRVGIKDAPIKHMIYTPTMRVPTNLGVNTDVAYTATLAALKTIDRYNKYCSNYNDCIRTILIPPMGTGTGGIQMEVAIEQMLHAFFQYSMRPKMRSLFRDGKVRDQLIFSTWRHHDNTKEA